MSFKLGKNFAYTEYFLCKKEETRNKESYIWKGSSLDSVLLQTAPWEYFYGDKIFQFTKLYSLNKTEHLLQQPITDICIFYDTDICIFCQGLEWLLLPGLSNSERAQPVLHKLI